MNLCRKELILYGQQILTTALQIAKRILVYCKHVLLALLRQHPCTWNRVGFRLQDFCTSTEHFRWAYRRVNRESNEKNQLLCMLKEVRYSRREICPCSSNIYARGRTLEWGYCPICDLSRRGTIYYTELIVQQKVKSSDDDKVGEPWL